MTKLKNILFVFAVLVSSFTFAQELGIKGGLNSSLITTNRNFENVDARFGFHAGLYYSLPISERFSVQPELLYETMGTKFKNSGYNLRLNTNYISIPLMFQFKPISKLKLEAGPKLAFMVGHKYKSSDKDVSEFINFLDKETKYNKVDFGLGFGATFNVTQTVGISARFTTGLSDIIKNNDTKERNNIFQLGVNLAL